MSKSLDISVIQTGAFFVNTLIVPLCEKYVFIVDPGACEFSGDEHKIISYISKSELIPVAVVLTHGHFDHIFGLPSLKVAFQNLPIVIHKLDKNMIGTSSADIQKKYLLQMGLEQFLPAVSNLPEASAFLEENKTLSDCVPLNFADAEKSAETESKIKSVLQKWKIIHTPGHTPGSVCLYNESDKYLISGDTLFYHSFGRTDLYGGNESELFKSLKLLRNLIKYDTLVYPGHEFCGFRFDE